MIEYKSIIKVMLYACIYKFKLYFLLIVIILFIFFYSIFFSYLMRMIEKNKVKNIKRFTYINLSMILIFNLKNINFLFV